ncbi:MULTISPECIES: helix-turn-helix domain-containing protein [Haloferax]|uniref:DNA-binding protein n=1 Tax=Haloferax marinum TaxID=2666143 RepID=A0A6A8G5X6_9EURY|nr:MULTISPECIES: helix-turn-helix domain-containing protein [Haloferax]KAB1197005.1 DNA-binding protein [Haloferax sp. CBA1150]MRW96028.1 DNA-binding protein [Haloferax marinum]
MCLIAEVLVPLSALPPGQSVERYDVQLELEQLVPVSADERSYLWVRGPDATSFQEAIESALGTDAVQLVGTVPNGALYGSDWDFGQSLLLAGLSEYDAVLLECVTIVDFWRLRLRVPSHSALSGLKRYWANNGIDSEFDRISALDSVEAPVSESLTDSQREALLLALERGYFDEHRRTSLDELGSELDISRQAVAARLRRAYRTLAEIIREGTR